MPAFLNSPRRVGLLAVAALALLALLGLGYSLYRDSQAGAASPARETEPAPASAPA